MTRRPSVGDSTDKRSSTGKRDGYSEAADRSLRMVPIGSEDTKSFTEVYSERSTDDHTGQKDGADGAQQAVTSGNVELGIQNKGIELDEELKDAKEGDKKKQNSSETSALDQQKDGDSTSKSPETLQSDHAANPTANAITTENATAKTEGAVTTDKKPPENKIITHF